MNTLNTIAIIWIIIGIISAIILIFDVIKHPQQMKIMDAVWPINALWGGTLILFMGLLHTGTALQNAHEHVPYENANA